MWIWHLGMWFRGGPGSDGFMVGLHGLREIFQPSGFYDSILKGLFLPKWFCDLVIPTWCGNKNRLERHRGDILDNAVCVIQVRQ